MAKNIFGITVLLIAAFIIAGGSSLRAQPPVDGYMKGKGNYVLSTSVTYEDYEEYWAGEDNLVPVGRTATTLSIYGVGGLTDWLDASVNIPFVTTGAFSSFQDLNIYLKGRPLQVSGEKGKFDLMLAGGFRTPMSDYETESQHAVGQQATAFDGRMVLQYSMNSGWFVMVQGGYTYRLDPTPSSAVYALKFGKASAKYYMDVWLDGQYSWDGSDYRDGSGSSFRTLGVSYNKVGVTYYRPFGQRSGWAITPSYILNGRNVGKALAVSGSYIYQFNIGQ